MHFSDGHVPAEYIRYIDWKLALITVIVTLFVVVLVYSISLGAANIPLIEVV